ncbi:hypothetical protein DL96DRAFT_1610628 [Flagelloscypha sp. PMI_526]|nr:hypothetical protein DL96DRAFT_1610628 [Flagelloscypha sp. PMI_526]
MENLPVELQSRIFGIAAWSLYGYYSTLVELIYVCKAAYASAMPVLYHSIILNPRTFDVIMRSLYTNDSLFSHCRALSIEFEERYHSGYHHFQIWENLLPAMPNLLYLTTSYTSASPNMALNAMLTVPIRDLDLSYHFNTAQMFKSYHRLASYRSQGPSSFHAVTHLSITSFPHCQFEISAFSVFPSLTHLKMNYPDVMSGRNDLFLHVLRKLPRLQMLLLTRRDSHEDMATMQARLSPFIGKDPRVVVVAYPKHWGKRREAMMEFFESGLCGEHVLWRQAQKVLAAWEGGGPCVMRVPEAWRR